MDNYEGHSHDKKWETSEIVRCHDIMKRIHLIMPMGGKGSRFSDENFDVPKPLIRLNGKPFFYWSTMSIAKFINVVDIIFVVLKEHVEKFKIDKEIRNFFPNAKIHIIPKVLNGATLTCMEGLEEVHDDLPVVFNDCDHMFRSRAFEKFLKSDEQIDGALLTFWSEENKFSYLKLNEQGNVTGTVEKQVISNDAICGCYYFLNKKIFETAVGKYMIHCSYKEFFLSGVYNVICSEGALVKAFRTDFHIPFGVPEEYKIAKESGYFKEFI